MNMRMGKLRIGEMMLMQGLISQDQLTIALKEQDTSKLLLGKQLVQLGFVTEAMVRDLLAADAGRLAVDLSKVVADAEALRRVPESFARRHHILPISFNAENQQLTIASTDIYNVVVLDQLRHLIGADIHLNVLFAADAQLQEYIDRFYGFELSVDGILKEIETGDLDHASLNSNRQSLESAEFAQPEFTQPIVRLVGALLMDAVKHSASDIHFEPEHAYLRIRYRIDGVLRQVRSLHKSYWGGVLVRLKIMSGIDITETRAAQDGRIHMSICGRPIDFRVSTHPTIHGENIVLRILDREKSILSLQQIGIQQNTLQTLLSMLKRPEGMLIFTGPTGSGKTTTLYSLLSELNTESVNIMTLEDPVEYPLTRIRQTSVMEANKLDFSNGIRSIMRQDPDIILVGEIRDEDTANMAFRAAMTGHQVFTTLHTNSALGVFPRLSDIGIPSAMMAGNMIGVVAQRLVRVLCPACKQPHSPDAQERKLLRIAHEDAIQIFKAQGCVHCGNQGYRGRSVIMELLSIDDEIDALISRNAHLDELRSAAYHKGFTPLADDAIRLVLNGTTSLEEVTRVIDLNRHIHQ